MGYVVKGRNINARQAAEHFAFLVMQKRKVGRMTLLPGAGTVYAFKLIGGVTTYHISLHPDGWEISVAGEDAARKFVD